MTKARDTSNLVSSQTGVAVTITGDPIVLGVGNTELVRVTADGSIGIADSNPTSLLSLKASASAGIGSTIPDIALRDKNGTTRLQIRGADADFSRFANQILSENYHLDIKVAGPAQNTLRVFTSTTGDPDDANQRLCVLGNGNIGIGTSTPDAKIDIDSTSTSVESTIRSRSDFSTELHLTTQNNTSANADSVIRFYRSRGTGASPAAVQTGDRISRAISQAWDGSSYITASVLESRVEGTVATGSVPSNLRLQLRTVDGNVHDCLTVDSQGSFQVGIASTAAVKSGYTSVKPSFVVGGLIDKSQNMAVIRGYNGGSGMLSLQRTNGTARDQTYVTTDDGNILGSLVFEGVNSSNNPYPSASIESWQVGTAGAYVGGDIRFLISRTNDGLVELARMSHNNNNVRSFMFGLTTTAFAEAIAVRPNYNGSTVNYGIVVACTGTSNIAMRFANSNGIVGSITMSGSSTAYNTSSDYRLKENVSSITGALERLMQLNPIRFNWISDETNTQIDGFLAHEVSPVVPESVNGTKDEMNTEENVLILDNKIHSLGITSESWNAIQNDPNRNYEEYPENVEWRSSFTEPKYQGIDQAKLVPLLTAALKELTVKVNALEAAVGIAST